MSIKLSVKGVILSTLGFLFILFATVSLLTTNKKLSSTIENQAEKALIQFKKDTGIQIEWQNLSFNLLKFQVQLKDVSISHSSLVLKGVQKIKTITARVSLFQYLIKDKIFFSVVRLNEGDFDLNLDVLSSRRSKVKNQKIDLPVKTFFIHNTQAKIEYAKHQLDLKSLKGKFKKKNLAYQFQISIDKLYLDDESQYFQITTLGFISKDKIKLSDMKLKSNDSQILVSSLNIYSQYSGLSRFEIKSQGKISSEELNRLSKMYVKEHWNLEGIFDYKLDLEYKNGKGYKGDFEIKSLSPLLAPWRLHSFYTKGQILKNKIIIKPSWIKPTKNSYIEVDQAGFFYKKKQKDVFSFSIRTTELSSDFIFKDVFQQNYSPIKTRLNGQIKCLGSWNYKQLNCKTQLDNSQLEVLTKKSRLFTFYQGKLDGSLSWVKENLDFEFRFKKNKSSELKISGKYKNPSKKLQLNFQGFTSLTKDVQFYTSLAHQGQVQFKGNLSVTEQDFFMESKISADNLYIYKFHLKNLQGHIRAQNDQFYFENFTGRTNKTNYSLQSRLNLDEDVFYLKAQFPNFKLQDLRLISQNWLRWPKFKLKGQGQADFDLELPYLKNKNVRFKIKSSLKHLQIFNEIFNTANLELEYKDKKGNLQDFSLTKEQGLIKNQGEFDLNSNINLKTKGTRLPLEGLNIINSLFPFSQSGNLNFQGQVTGSLGFPKIQGSAEILNTYLYTYPVEDSQLQFDINPDTLSLKGRLMKQVFLKDFLYKFKDNSFYLRARAKQWNFSKFFLSKLKKGVEQNFYSSLHGDIELSQNSQKKLTGNINIDHVLISKGNKWIKNQRTFLFKLQDNSWELSPVNLVHYDKKVLKISSYPERQSISGHTHLDLWSLYLPFLKNLQGTAYLQVSIPNNSRLIRPSGFLTITNGALSIPYLPDFTNIKTKAVFDQTHISIPSLTAQAGGGRVQIQGKTKYLWNSDLPNIDFSLKFFNAQLELPKDFYTKGTGSLTIKGQKAPYLIKGTYNISEGTIKKDWGARQDEDFDSSLISRQSKKEDGLFQLGIKLQALKPLIINNSFLHTLIDGGLYIHGPLQDIMAKGQIQMTNQDNALSFLTFRNQDFEIIKGSIIYANTPINEPLLSVQAQTILEHSPVEQDKVTWDSAQDIEQKYRVLLTAKGRAKDLDISLTSEPELSEKDIISMLAFGFDSKGFDKKTDLTQYSYQLIGSYFLAPIGKGLKDVFDLGFNITPYLNKKTNESVTKITLKKNWFTKLQTSFSRTIEEEPISDIRLKYSLKNNMSLTAFWEDTEQNSIESDLTEQNKVGLDFEFNIEF